MHKNSRRRKMKNDKIKKKEFFELQAEKAEIVVFKKAVKQITQTFADVSINDSANLTVSHNKLKKSMRKVEEVKIEEVKKEEIASWELADEDEYDYVQDENEDGTITLVKKQIVTQTRKTKESSGKDYPTDIWILISGFIRPEDVGRFAAICRTSYSVTCTANFWYSLYRRHYRFQDSLPLSLRPRNIFRQYGIRTSVIRALFHLYPPFVAKLSRLETHPGVLCRGRCVLAWQKAGRSCWFYYFKLKEAGSEKNDQKQDLIEILQDIEANSEDGCRLLRIISKNFYPVPPVEGLFLASVDVRLSSTLSEQNVFLKFVSAWRYSNGKIDGANSTTVQINHAVKINVLDWWDSRYPYVNSLKLSLN